jgi:hypothetical protein
MIHGFGSETRQEPFGRHRRRREDKTKMDLQEVGWRDKDSIYLTQDRDRFTSCCECGNEPSRSIKRGEFLD